MRVISGKYRGKPLLSPTGKDIRPTGDKVKGAIFNMLRMRLNGAVFIDFFAGSGAIGIEALSNGAGKVYFVDSSKDSIALIKKNLEKITDPYEIIETDFLRAADVLLKRGVKSDVVFADPPYCDSLEGSIISIATKLLTNDGLLVVEHGRNIKVPPNGLLLVSEKNYGITSVSVFRKPKIAAVTGTFDPFTEGHKFLVEKALEEFDMVYVVHLINPDKTMKYPLKKRIAITKESLSTLSDKVIVESYDGTAVDYCVKHGVSAIVRGYRTNDDLKYEREMADYNFNLSKIQSVLYEATRKDISSTEVKRRIVENEAINGFVSDCVIKELL